MRLYGPAGQDNALLGCYAMVDSSCATRTCEAFPARLLRCYTATVRDYPELSNTRWADGI